MLFNQRWKGPDLEKLEVFFQSDSVKRFLCVVYTNVRSKTNSRSDAGQWCHYRHVDLIEPKLKGNVEKSENMLERRYNKL